jgi:hypothetical protein
MPTIKESEYKPHIGKMEPIPNPVSPIYSRIGAEPMYPTYPRFSVTALPLSVTYSGDALRGFYRGGVPQSRIIPVSSD